MSEVDTLLAQHAPWANVDRQWTLTPFETFMWLDDRPQYPLLFEINLQFAGDIDPEAMRDAWRFALGRHPLLRSTIQATSRHVQWHAPATGWSELNVVSKGDKPPLRAMAVDLEKSTGLHGWLSETAVGWDVKMLFHHACCDGQGARMFLQDLVLAYAVLRGSSKERDPFFAADIAHLDRRGEYPPTVGLDNSSWRKFRKAFQWAFLTPQPTAIDAPLVNRSPNGDGSLSVLGCCSHTFEADVVAQMQDPRQRSGAALNDIAVAMLFATLGEWQRDHGTHPNARVRVTVPFDLRNRDDERMPATNRYTYMFLNRRLRECGDWATLLPGVQSEMQTLRQSRMGVEFLEGLRSAAKWPQVLRWVLQRGRCASTAVLTNLSDPSRRLRKRLRVDSNGFMWLDNAQCLDIQIQTPPLRPGTRWGFGIFEYARRMTISFRYDTTTITPAAAQNVLNRYVGEWHAWLADASAGRSA